VRRRSNQPDGRRGRDRQGALGACQEPGQPAAVLGQQVLHRIARDLAREPAELGPDHSEIGLHQGGQPGAHRVGQLVQPAGLQAATVGQQQRQRLDVVGGASVGQRVRAAGIVADHAADRAARVGGGIRTEPQPVRCRRQLQIGQDQAGLDGRGAGLRVERDQPIEVPGEVQHDAGTDGVSGAGRSGTAGGQRRTGAAGDPQGQRDLVGVPGKDHHLGHHPVVRGVGGVLGPPPGAGIHLGNARPAKLGGQRLGVHAVNLAVLASDPASRGLLRRSLGQSAG
jgi:hypothetical protein